jgi:hypothetical protein
MNFQNFLTPRLSNDVSREVKGITNVRRISDPITVSEVTIAIVFTSNVTKDVTDRQKDQHMRRSSLALKRK